MSSSLSSVKLDEIDLPPLEEAEAALCRLSLAEFIRCGWPVLEPSTPLEWNWHIPAIADHIQAALEGWMEKQRNPDFEQIIQNLMINIPPGTAKSRIVSVFAPAWMWIHWPAWRSIFLSANPRVALRDSMYCRQLIESEWYQESFRPEWQLAPDQNAKSLFRNTAGGMRFAAGIMAKITGDRADALFVDDPHDAEEVHSDTLRKAVLDRWDFAIGNRVNDLRSSLRFGIMQRLHESDWSGHNVRKGGWVHLSIPMEYEEEPSCPCADCQRRVSVIGWRDPRTKQGDLLFPLRFTPTVLAAERLRLGSTGYAGQMQQWPVPAGGAIFKEDWFVPRYKTLPELLEVWTTWDTTLKEGEENAESACMVAGLAASGNMVILRVLHGHWETPDIAKFLVDQATWLRNLYGDRYKGDYVEDKVNGSTLIQYIRRTNPELVLIPIKVEGDKQMRAHGVTPFCEARRVLFPDTTIFPDAAQWVSDTIGQLKMFPLGTLKDIVDVFVYGCKRMLGTLGRKKSRRGKSGGMV